MMKKKKRTTTTTTKRDLKRYTQQTKWNEQISWNKNDSEQRNIKLLVEFMSIVNLLAWIEWKCALLSHTMHQSHMKSAHEICDSTTKYHHLPFNWRQIYSFLVKCFFLTETADVSIIHFPVFVIIFTLADLLKW